MLELFRNLEDSQVTIRKLFENSEMKMAPFRKLVTDQYMPGFDYLTSYTFQTVFFMSDYSYCCCPCAIQHEFVDYVAENGEINEEVYEKIVQSIANGKCPHVSDKIPYEWLRMTSISAVNIAVAVETEKQAGITTTVAIARAEDVHRLPSMYSLQSIYRPLSREGIFDHKLHEMALHKASLPKLYYIQFSILQGTFLHSRKKIKCSLHYQ